MYVYIYIYIKPPQKFFKLFHLFTYLFWLCGLVASRGLLLFHTWGFSLWWVLIAPDSGAQAQQPWDAGLVALRMWGLPESGMEPTSPALAGGFFTTEPPGKPRNKSFFFFFAAYTYFIYLIESCLMVHKTFSVVHLSFVHNEVNCIWVFYAQDCSIAAAAAIGLFSCRIKVGTFV